MVKVNIGAVIALVIMFLAVIGLIIAYVILNNHLHDCENKESPYCFSLMCPPGEAGPLCAGFAQREQDGKIYCSYAPLTAMGSA
jgi:hypothetical protein